MKVHKLYQVLVVGGALVSGGTAFAQGSNSCQNQSAAAQSIQLSMAAQPSEPSPCFCNQDDCCEVTETGEKRVKDGFVCCWGTSCEDSSN